MSALDLQVLFVHAAACLAAYDGRKCNITDWTQQTQQTSAILPSFIHSAAP